MPRCFINLPCQNGVARGGRRSCQRRATLRHVAQVFLPSLQLPVGPQTCRGARCALAERYGVTLSPSAHAAIKLTTARPTGLQEANALMRDLQRYAEKARRSSGVTSDQGAHVQHSVVEISKLFADDMIHLHKLIPYDTDAFATNSRRRAKFVLRKKDIVDVLSRLESRKSAATLSLQVAGRFVVPLLLT